MNPTATTVTLTEQDVLRICLTKGLRPATRREYLRSFRLLGLLDRPITLADCVLAVEHYSNINTRRKVSIAIRSVTGFALPVPKGTSRSYYVPSQDEYDFYRATFRFPIHLDLMYYAGLRVSEAVVPVTPMGNVLTVRYSNYQQQLQPAKTVGNVVIPSWLAKTLPQPALDNSNVLTQAVRAHSKRTGIPLLPHGLRAAYATRLFAKGMSLNALQSQMRHADVSTTVKYLQGDVDLALIEAL